MYQFNFGVIGLFWEEVKIFDCLLELMDEFYLIVNGVYIFEEFVLVVVVYKWLELVGCIDLIYYYWSWKQLFCVKIQVWLCKYGFFFFSVVVFDDIFKVID